MPPPPISAFWTLSCLGVTVTAAEAGVTDITRKRASQAADTCTLRFDGRPFDAALPFPFGETVILARAGVTWFAGRVTSVPTSGNDQAEGQICELTGPWWYLAQLVYQQTWTIQGGAATAATSRIVLGQAADGSTLTTGQVITDALQFAIDAGAPFAIGTVDPSVAAPLDEVKEITCAQVIQKMMRWHPDTVAWFDYTTAPVPTFYCRTRANLPAATLAVGAPPLAAVRGLTARYDLLPPAVVFHFESTRLVNGQAQTDVVTDASPAGATGREFGAVVGTIPLRGGSATVLSQRITTQEIPTGVGGANVAATLASLSPALAVAAADPTLAAGGVTITSLDRGPTPGSIVLPDFSLGNVLVGGEVTEWMATDCGVRTEAQLLTFSYTLDRTGGSETSQTSVNVTATNAASGLYTTTSTYRPGDSAPTGLAAAYHGALSLLQYSGDVVLVEPEAGGVASAGLGGVINLTGGRGGGVGGDARDRGGGKRQRGRWHDDADARAGRGGGGHGAGGPVGAG